MKMKTYFGGIMMLVLLQCGGALAGSGEETAAARARALADGWPDSPVGLTAGGWIEAFNTGEEAMQAYLTANLSTESLAKRSLKTRLAIYRSLSDRFGTLMLASVIEASHLKLTVKIVAEDTSSHSLVFELEAQAPHRLLQVSMLQSGHGGH